MAERGTEHRADEETRREHAAGSADADGEARREHLPHEQDEEEPYAVGAGDAVAQHRVTDAVHLRQHEQEQPEQDAADARSEPLGAAPHPLADVLNGVEHPREPEPDQPGHEAEHAEEQELRDVVHLERRQAQEGVVAEGGTADHAGGHCGEDDHPEGARGEVGEDQLHREEDPGERGVEGGGDPAGGTAGEQDPASLLRDPGDAAQRGAEGRPDLDDRTLATYRATTTDARRRGQCLDQRHPSRDVPTTPSHREHHLGNAVTAGLARERVHQRAVEQTGSDRGKDHEPTTEERHVRVDETRRDREVLVAREDVGEAADQPPESDRPEAGARPDHQREDDEPGLREAEPAPQPLVRRETSWGCSAHGTGPSPRAARIALCNLCSTKVTRGSGDPSRTTTSTGSSRRRSPHRAHSWG